MKQRPADQQHRSLGKPRLSGNPDFHAPQSWSLRDVLGPLSTERAYVLLV